MKIIVGLGNPGEKYKKTRHNVGFLALDKIVERLKAEDFRLEKKFDAEVARFKFRGEEILLAKPQTFMNLSGKAVKKIVDFYKLKPEQDLIVIHDDIDLELGRVKIKNKGSSAGHNGVQSIIDELGTESFVRVRIGVGRPASTADRPENDKIAVEDWVLMSLSEEEIKGLEKVFDNLIQQGIKYI